MAKAILTPLPHLLPGLMKTGVGQRRCDFPVSQDCGDCPTGVSTMDGAAMEQTARHALVHGAWFFQFFAGFSRRSVGPRRVDFPIWRSWLAAIQLSKSRISLSAATLEASGVFWCRIRGDHRSGRRSGFQEKFLCHLRSDWEFSRQSSVFSCKNNSVQQQRNRSRSGRVGLQSCRNRCWTGWNERLTLIYRQ
jgi:hypothetical protein